MTEADPGRGLEFGAFESLYRATRDDIYAYVATLVRDRSAAEDVTAAAFEKAYRRRFDYRPDRGTARAWLFAIARNTALDELRRIRKSASPVEEPAAPVAGADATVATPDHETRMEIRDAVDRLPGPDRELIALRYFADLPLVEIAAALGITESNAGTRTHRAVAKLRRAIDERD